jgi:hypothetical protein
MGPIDPAKSRLLLRLGVDVALGDRQDAAAVARELLALAVDLVPVDELKEFLTDRDRVFADLETDVAEEIKLSGINKP